MQFPGRHVEFYFPLAFYFPALLLQFLMIKFGDRVKLSTRVVASFLLCAAVLVAAPIIANSLETDMAFWTLMVLMFLTGTLKHVSQLACGRVQCA